ncbi:MAG: GH116 family glycosyl hydrolase, partial [Planctomycetota bacterium]
KNWVAADENGVARGQQFNTYDTSVVGPNTFIGSQFLAALRASEEMAKVCDDPASAERWHSLFEKSSAAYASECWDDEYKYFVQRIPQGQRASDYGNACFVDQVLGQWWALVNGLGYVLPQDKVDASLAAIAKWNMVGDMSLYKYHYEKPRIFIWGPGKGLLMCLWPRGDYIPKPILYREEVWTGCEYHAAASMIWEGLLPEGLAVVKAIHERYNDGVRCPWNEIECGDHYSRAMSSWSVLLACQGFSYVGPRGQLSFNPRVLPENHKSFFSGAQGWGLFTQKRKAQEQQNTLEVKWGQLRVTELAFGLPAGVEKAQASLKIGNAQAEAKARFVGGKMVITLDPPQVLTAGSTLQAVTRW